MALEAAKTHITLWGNAVRMDSGLGGLLCYVRRSGLIYAVARSDAAVVEKWLTGEIVSPPAPIYLSILGADQLGKHVSPQMPIPHLLPDEKSWNLLPSPDRPILINWLITGRCPLACRYCYAEDLMRNDDAEPISDQIAEMAESILSFAPVAVVLTGGDPLFTPHLATAMKYLAGRVGVMVDTSGYTLKTDHIRLFKEHRVNVRISIDSQVPRIHEHQRPVSALYPRLVERGKTLEAAMNALTRCMEAGVSVTVQTVATKRTANDLVSLGDVLFRLGVRSWRIFKVAPSKANMAGYTQLVGTHTDDGREYRGKQAKGPYDHAFARVLAARKANWLGQMSVQVTPNDSPNSVILVSPDGRFVTESNTGAGKILLDPRRPKLPRLSALRSTIDMQGHAARYLNLTTPHTN
jgi:MoaA/NifB/PqqE/SkfB family radical SAM enzyme